MFQAAVRGCKAQLVLQNSCNATQHHTKDVELPPGSAHQTVVWVQEDLETLKREQVSAEMQMVEVLEELLQSFERSYSELVEGSKQLIMSFFTTVRDLEGTFHAQLVVAGQKLYDEKYNIEVCLSVNVVASQFAAAQIVHCA
jgi:hypothetical protein